MKDLLNKRTVSLVLIYLLFMVTSSIIYFASGNFTYRTIVVNLFLACVPLGFATLDRIAKQRGKKLACVVSTLLWLAFFPNSFYMITNFIHILHFGFDSYFVALREAVAWFALVYMTLGIMLGVLVGVFSLDIIMRPIFKRKGRVIGAAAVIAVSLLSGYAICIGRFLRFNSWDLLANPLSLAETLIQSFSLFTVLYSLMFAACTAFIYLMFCILKGKSGDV